MADDPWAGFADAPAAPAGGADPWSAFADAPASAPASPGPAGDKGGWAAAVAGALDGIPIAGPYVLGGAQKALAWARSNDRGTPYADELAAVQGSDNATAGAHPYATTGGNLVGGAIGVAPAVAAAPAAFGLGEGALAARAAAGAASGAGIGGADAAARGQDVATGALLGGALGGATPAAGALIGKGVQAARGAMQPVAPELQGLNRTARGFVDRAVGDADPAQMQAAADALGPSGFFGERSPGLMQLSNSVAQNAGDGRAVVRDAFAARQDGRNARVGALVDGALGPADSPLAYQAGLNGQAGPLAAAQQQALGAAGPVDISGAYQRLAGALPNAAPGSPEHAALGQALQMLAEKPAGGASPSTWERDVMGSGQVPEMPADLPDAPAFGDQPAPSRPGPVGVPRPVDLHAFVRGLGGIQDKGGDLAAMGFTNLVARPGQGLGADAMRQAAAQMGYLGPNIDEATAGTSVNDLLNAIGSDNPIHSVFDESAAAQWAARDAAMADYQQRGGNSSYPVARPAGPRPTAPGLPFSGDPGFDPAQPAAMQPTTNAQRIYSARQAIDDRINYGGPTLDPPSSAMRSQQGAYQGIRAALANALREQVPGYADATDSLAALNRQKDAVRDGVDALGAGKSAIRPDDCAGQFGALSPEEQAAYRVGMRSTVDQALGTRANDLQALRGVTQGENGWNAQKLGQAFGQPAVDAINTGIDQEAAMAANNARINGNSNTSSNQADRALTEPGQPSGLLGGVKNWWDELYIDKPSTYLPAGQVWGHLRAGAYEQARNQVAPLLTRSGAEADALQRAVIAARLSRASIPMPSMDPLLRAMVVANQTGRQQLQGQ